MSEPGVEEVLRLGAMDVLWLQRGHREADGVARRIVQRQLAYLVEVGFITASAAGQARLRLRHGKRAAAADTTGGAADR